MWQLFPNFKSCSLADILLTIFWGITREDSNLSCLKSSINRFPSAFPGSPFSSRGASFHSSNSENKTPSCMHLPSLQRGGSRPRPALLLLSLHSSPYFFCLPFLPLGAQKPRWPEMQGTFFLQHCDPTLLQTGFSDPIQAEDKFNT